MKTFLLEKETEGANTGGRKHAASEARRRDLLEESRAITNQPLLTSITLLKVSLSVNLKPGKDS